MPYILERCVAGKTIEYRKYYTHKIHPKSVKREKTQDETPERIKKANQRKAETTLRRLMNANFEDGDYLIKLDFHFETPSGSKEMQKEMQTFIRRLKYRFDRNERPFKYIYVKEVGSKGGRHVHMLVNKCPIEWIRECWKAGGIHVDPLYSQGQYAQIASYFIKYAEKTEKTEGEIIGKRWYASRNLKKPKVTKKIVKADRYSDKVKHQKGYFLDKNSIEKGINILGYVYFSYTLIQIPKEGG